MFYFIKASCLCIMINPYSLQFGDWGVNNVFFR